MSTYDDRAAYMREYRKRKIGKLHAQKDFVNLLYSKDPSEENLKKIQEVITDIAIHNTERGACYKASVKYCVQ